MARFNYSVLIAFLVSLSPAYSEEQPRPELVASDSPGTQNINLPEQEIAGIRLVHLPGGFFIMGSPVGERGRDDDETMHEVCVTDFWMAKYETTNAQFRAFSPHHDSKTFRGQTLNDPQQPAVRISYRDAEQYTRWLSEQTGRRFRLATEAEWEYAARAGTDTARYWGNDPELSCEYANSADASLMPLIYFYPFHTCDDGFALTAPVGQLKPNAFGLYDMLGNVWEITCSEYQVYYEGAEQLCPEAYRPMMRIANRGGGWSSVHYRVRSAARTSSSTDYKNRDLGLRLVMDSREGE